MCQFGRKRSRHELPAFRRRDRGLQLRHAKVPCPGLELVQGRCADTVRWCVCVVAHQLCTAPPSSSHRSAALRDIALVADCPAPLGGSPELQPIQCFLPAERRASLPQGNTGVTESNWLALSVNVFLCPLTYWELCDIRKTDCLFDPVLSGQRLLCQLTTNLGVRGSNPFGRAIFNSPKCSAPGRAALRRFVVPTQNGSTPCQARARLQVDRVRRRPSASALPRPTASRSCEGRQAFRRHDRRRGRALLRVPCGSRRDRPQASCRLACGTHRPP